MTSQPAGTPCRYSSGFVDDPSTYFELLQPIEPTDRPPVLMITGGAHSAACYLATADGKPGWAHDFVRAGYPVALVDWPGVGRSGYVPPADHGSRRVVDGVKRVLERLAEPTVVLTHSISGAFGWKLIEECPDLVAAVIGVAPASPGNMGKELGRLVSEDGNRKLVAMASGDVMIDIAAPTVLDPGFAQRKLVGRSSRFPEDRLKSYFASLLPVPGRITYERTNIGGAQLRIERFESFEGKPVLIVTPTDDIDHPRELDYEIVSWLGAAGASAELLFLGDIGIAGNGHMLMLEENSSETAAAIVAWIDRAVG